MIKEVNGIGWRRLSSLLCFVFSLSVAQAGLVFESNRFKVEAGEEQEKVEAFYHFENKGDEVEVITMVKSVCPLCLSAGVKGGTKGEGGFSFQPGEKGIIRAVFSTGNLAGDIEKTVESAHPSLQPGAGAAFSVEGENDERLIIVQEII